MKHTKLRRLFFLCVLVASNAPAATRYVDVNSANPTPPYTNWSTAATNIQAAVDVAVTGDQILVTNGVYQTGVTNQSRVVVDKPVTVQSVNGPQLTTIEGGLMIRCVYLANGTFLAGFTLTNGNVFFGGLGGGVAFGNLQSDAIVSNCVIVACAAGWGGGAASAVSSGGPPGISGGTLLNCTFKGNLANGAPPGFGFPPASGGAADGCKLINCTITGNTAAGPSAAQGGGASSCVLQNCLLTGNSAVQGPGGGAAYSDLINCTVVSNTASFVGGTYASYLRSCIVYYNSDPDHAADNYVKYSCTTPLADGPGNITNAPLFVDATAGNFRLQSNSPCINAGNNADVVGSTDLDGRPRNAAGTVDMGTYEFQPSVSGVFLGWLQQYGLSTDGSADYSDSDSDLLNNWQEWIAGTLPTDASSALRLLNPSNNPSSITVSWQSVSNRAYFLERATDFGAAPPFSLLTSNIVGQTGTTSYTDTNAIGASPFFYRVGVQ